MMPWEVAKRKRRHYNALTAPVAQWIEQARPKGEIEVRFLLGALFDTLRVNHENTDI